MNKLPRRPNHPSLHMFVALIKMLPTHIIIIMKKTTKNSNEVGSMYGPVNSVL